MSEQIESSDQEMPRRMIRLVETDQTVADPAQDIRGRTVRDRSGEEIGKVDALLMDKSESKIRAMRVTGGGFLGIGDKTVLIPIDAIARITEDEVVVDQMLEHVAGAPDYDPKLAEADEGYWGGLYSYYGYAPYWSAGYVYPGFPAVPPGPVF